jgi:hypothetical protein
VQHHELALVQLHRRVGDHPLDALLLGEQRAVREALERAVDHHVERDLRLADPAHAVREPRRPEPRLAEQVPWPRPPSMFSFGTRRFSMRISAWL